MATARSDLEAHLGLPNEDDHGNFTCLAQTTKGRRCPRSIPKWRLDCAHQTTDFLSLGGFAVLSREPEPGKLSDMLKGRLRNGIVLMMLCTHNHVPKKNPVHLETELSKMEHRLLEFTDLHVSELLPRPSRAISNNQCSPPLKAPSCSGAELGPRGDAQHSPLPYTPTTEARPAVQHNVELPVRQTHDSGPATRARSAPITPPDSPQAGLDGQDDVRPLRYSPAMAAHQVQAPRGSMDPAAHRPTIQGRTVAIQRAPVTPPNTPPSAQVDIRQSLSDYNEAVRRPPVPGPMAFGPPLSPPRPRSPALSPNAHFSAELQNHHPGAYQPAAPIAAAATNSFADPRRVVDQRGGDHPFRLPCPADLPSPRSPEEDKVDSMYQREMRAIRSASRRAAALRDEWDSHRHLLCDYFWCFVPKKSSSSTSSPLPSSSSSPSSRHQQQHSIVNEEEEEEDEGEYEEQQQLPPSSVVIIPCAKDLSVDSVGESISRFLADQRTSAVACRLQGVSAPRAMRVVSRILLEQLKRQQEGLADDVLGRRVSRGFLDRQWAGIAVVWEAISDLIRAYSPLVAYPGLSADPDSPDSPDSPGLTESHPLDDIFYGPISVDLHDQTHFM